MQSPRVSVGGRALKLSNLDKELYPGTPKNAVVDYYARVADTLLPHLAGRPVTLRRFPDGIDGESFYEKNAGRNAPSWLRTVVVPTPGSSRGSSSASFVVASVPFLPRKHLSRSKDKFRQAGPNSPTPSPCGSLDLELTPLLTSLEAIIKLLTSGPWPFVVESAENVSEQYASYLDAYVQDITYNPRVRERFVFRYGMEGWREERLLVGWEAALFRAGFLTRWAVLVHQTERVD